MTKLPLGSRERDEEKWGLEQEIIKLADVWERARERVITNQISAEAYYRRCEQLAAKVRKWRKL